MKLDFLSKQLLIFASTNATSLLSLSFFLLLTDSVAVTTFNRRVASVPTQLLVLTLLMLLLVILLGMMIVADACTERPSAVGEKLLQLTATAGFRWTCSAAACPVAGLHFQLLAQLRVVVQIKVQIAADGGDRNGIGHCRGNCISQTSSYFRHRRRRRPTSVFGNPGLSRLLQQSVGSRTVSRAR